MTFWYARGYKTAIAANEALEHYFASGIVFVYKSYATPNGKRYGILLND